MSSLGRVRFARIKMAASGKPNYFSVSARLVFSSANAHAGSTLLWERRQCRKKNKGCCVSIFAGQIKQ